MKILKIDFIIYTLIAPFLILCESKHFCNQKKDDQHCQFYNFLDCKSTAIFNMCCNRCSAILEANRLSYEEITGIEGNQRSGFNSSPNDEYSKFMASRASVKTRPNQRSKNQKNCLNSHFSCGRTSQLMCQKSSVLRRECCKTCERLM